MPTYSRFFPFLPFLLGASEALFSGDCNHDGMEDSLDLQTGISRDCNGNGIPDECDLSPRLRFQAPQSFDSGSGKPSALTAADLDADGRPDVAVGFSSNSISLFWNDGEGNFPESSGFPSPSPTNNILSVDLNGDGNLDLVISTFGDFQLLRNRGGRVFDDTFTYKRELVLFTTAADLNGDHSPDVILSSGLVLFNDGKGTFSPGPGDLGRFSKAGSAQPSFVVASDVNGDGHVDLATLGALFDGISLFQNRGDGSFGEATRLGQVGKEPSAAVACDLDGDQDVDFAVANSRSNDVSILINSGKATFLDPLLLPVQALTPLSITAADLDADGDLDLITSNSNSGNLSVFWNSGMATFPRTSLLAAGKGPQSTVAVDLDGDRDLDLATANSDGRSFTVLWNQGPGSFPGGEPIEAIEAGGLTRFLTPADLDTDGRPDLVISTNVGLELALNKGGRKLTPGGTIPLKDDPVPVKAADLDGDGDADLVAITPGRAAVFLNRGDATFEAGVQPSGP